MTASKYKNPFDFLSYGNKEQENIEYPKERSENLCEICGRNSA